MEQRLELNVNTVKYEFQYTFGVMKAEYETYRKEIMKLEEAAEKLMIERDEIYQKYGFKVWK